MITTTQNISHTQNTINLNRLSASNVRFSKNNNCVNFNGLNHKIQTTTDSKEIKELIRIFQNSLEMNIDGKISQPSKYYIVRKFQHFVKRLSALPFEFTAKQPDAITEIVKNSDNKIIGGFSTVTDTSRKSLYIGFLTIAPEYKYTKSFQQILKTMGEEIKTIAENLNLKKISWSTNKNNKHFLKFIKRINNTNVASLNSSEKIYTTSIQDFATALENI